MKMIGSRLRTLDTRSAKPSRSGSNDPFYRSPAWRAFVEQEIARRFGSRAKARCEDKACALPGRIGIRVYGDHIRELKDGGAPLSPANVLFRCGACHSRKTASERAKRNEAMG